MTIFHLDKLPISTIGKIQRKRYTLRLLQIQFITDALIFGYLMSKFHKKMIYKLKMSQSVKSVRVFVRCTHASNL